MKLSEIEMDLPYIKNGEKVYEIVEEGKEYKEAVRLDYELNWKRKRREFQLSTRCMTSMIERIMIPIETKECWKIIFECFECVEDEEYRSCRNLLGVYYIPILFDSKGYFNLNNLDKKKVIINSIMVGLEKMIDQIPFKVTNIIEACLKITENEYHNEWKWKRPIKIKERKAQIQIIHDVEVVHIYMILMDLNENIIDRKLIVSALPDEWNYSVYLGKIEKVSEDEVALVSKDGKKFSVKI